MQHKQARQRELAMFEHVLDFGEASEVYMHLKGAAGEDLDALKLKLEERSEMGRAPCCEKMGLKRGPWTAEEDQKLISHIQRYGHGNWRALPKQAGLLRCGKSCRLRWINYLRPDVKRGNLTAEEEETIIKLHETLGNKWSAIAARLPGRTDNEIKNVWHTHLKKRVNPTNPPAQETKRCDKAASAAAPLQRHSANVEVVSQTPGSSPAPVSTTSQSSGDLSCSGTDSSSVTRGNDGVVKVEEDLGDEGFSSVEFLGLDDSFWKDVFSVEEDYKMPAMGGGGGRFLTNEFQYDQHEMDFLLTAMPGAGDWPAL